MVHNQLDLAQPLSQLKNLPPLLDEISPEILQPAARARQPQQPRFDPSPRGALQRAWVRRGAGLGLGLGLRPGIRVRAQGVG